MEPRVEPEKISYEVRREGGEDVLYLDYSKKEFKIRKKLFLIFGNGI